MNFVIAEIPRKNKSNRLNNWAIQQKSLRKEIFQGADIKGKNSSPGIAVVIAIKINKPGWQSNA